MTSAAAGAIPRDTDVVSELEMNEELGGGELVLSTNNDAVIKAVNMYGEGVFEEEARFVYFPNPKTTARVFIRPPRDICADVSIKVLVSARMSSVYHVFELEFTLPKFCMYARLNAPVATPSGSVSFRLPGVNARRMATWIDGRVQHQRHGHRPRPGRRLRVRVREVRSIHWSPYDPVGVVNADP